MMRLWFKETAVVPKKYFNTSWIPSGYMFFNMSDIKLRHKELREISFNKECEILYSACERKTVTMYTMLN